MEPYDKNTFEIENGVLIKYKRRHDKEVKIPEGVVKIDECAFCKYGKYEDQGGDLGHRMGILGCSTAEIKMSLGC